MILPLLMVEPCLWVVPKHSHCCIHPAVFWWGWFCLCWWFGPCLWIVLKHRHSGVCWLLMIVPLLIAYSYGSPKLSRFSWRRKTILVAARRETWQFWSRRELHFSLLDERLSILVATCCHEAPQDLLISGRQTRQISSRREMRRGKRAERDMCVN